MLFPFYHMNYLCGIDQKKFFFKSLFLANEIYAAGIGAIYRPPGQSDVPRTAPRWPPFDDLLSPIYLNVMVQLLSTLVFKMSVEEEKTFQISPVESFAAFLSMKTGINKKLCIPRTTSLYYQPLSLEKVRLWSRGGFWAGVLGPKATLKGSVGQNRTAPRVILEDMRDGRKRRLGSKALSTGLLKVLISTPSNLSGAF
ncbi:hypothetical protein EDC94DRAFT_582422 [Helicostylum pulchrum]|nr:hypothetical protein EDC94DRAFT_582422 [Helicostylum pulchrum]